MKSLIVSINNIPDKVIVGHTDDVVDHALIRLYTDGGTHLGDHMKESIQVSRNYEYYNLNGDTVSFQLCEAELCENCQ